MTRVLTIGGDVPRQLVLAAGATPERLVADGSAIDEGSLVRARELLGEVDSAAIHILGRVLARHSARELDDVPTIVVSHDGQASLRVFYVLRMLARAGALSVPVHLLDLQRLPGSAVTAFNRRRLEALIEHLGRACGSPLDDEALARAARSEVALGDALAALRARRREDPGAIPADEVARLRGIARTTPPERAAAEISAVAAAPRPDPAGRGRPLAVLTGSSVADPSVLAALEDDGVTVVGDDHDTGDAEWIGRAVDPASAGVSVVTGLVDDFARRPPSVSFGSIADRAGAVARLAAECRADTVVSLARDGDEGPLWDAHAQRAAVEATGRTFVGPVPLDAVGAA